MKLTVAVISLVLAVVFFTSVHSQSCPSGHIFGDTCTQNCNTTGCNLECAGIPGMCMQQCQNAGVCPLVNCSSSGQCMQICTKSCDTLSCQSENCTQTCNEKCTKLVCDSKSCNQNCLTGGCEMECTDKAQSCLQSCTKDCKLICKAKDPSKCKQTCQQGGCTYDVPPANKTSCEPLISDKVTCMQTGCTYKDCRMACLKPTISQTACYQSCLPNIQPCPLSMTCDTENCHQTCLGKCEKAECGASTSCIQQCGGSCNSTRCTSKMCTQTCTDDCDHMECESENCIQVSLMKHFNNNN